MEPTELTRKQIVVAAFLIESLLASIFVIRLFMRPGEQFLAFTPRALPVAVLLTIPLLLFNFIIFEFLPRKLAALRVLDEFSNAFIFPIANALEPGSALLVSFLAGVGEELFFRGVLQNEVGLVLASIIFSVMHFGTMLVRYWIVAVVYCLIGLYFGVVYQISDSLLIAIMIHFFYDYAALIYLKYLRGHAD